MSRFVLGVALATSLTACGQTVAAPTSEPTRAAPPPPPSVPATPAPTEKVQPPNETAPTTDLPEGFRVTNTAEHGLGLVSGDVLLDWNQGEATVTRWDAGSLKEIGTTSVGTIDVFPPDLQSGSQGQDGVWLTIASEQAVGLFDPATGEITRKVHIFGAPYDVVEADGELWIANFEWSRITRYDLTTNAVVKEIGVGAPTDIIYADAAIWIPVHVGRGAEGGRMTPGGQVARIDPATNEVSLVNVGPRPYYMASGFGAVWTGTATGASVDRIDTTTMEVTTIWIGEDGAFDIEVVGDSVWAAVGPQYPRDRVCDPETSFFVRIDPTTRTVRERVAFPCAGSIVPDSDGFWVAGDDNGETVLRHFEPID